MMMKSKGRSVIEKIPQRLRAMLPVPAMMLLLSGCGGNAGDATGKKQETSTNGYIHISVDESFKPVIDSQIKVYQASFPDAHIIAEYKSEAECLKDLSNDSTRMVIVTRGLTKDEAKSFESKLSYKPVFGILAFDAVALILNKEAPDSLFTRADMQEILSGNTAYNYKVVMDGISATSTVRYAVDSILRGKPLGKNVEAAKSSPEVIDFVSKNPNAIGMIGVSWVGNRDDSEQLSFLNKVKIGSLQCDACPGEPFTKPYQANIATGRYAFTRGLYYILKENYAGLGRGFTNFMIYERGQLIFKRAYLLPAQMSFEVREVKISQ
jgi:phosphate transport system substrate-binding protein